MLVMEGGLLSRMQVTESLSDFTDAYQSVLRACEELEAYYENIKDSRKLGALSKELRDAIEEDFFRSRRNCKRISERHEQIIS